MKGKGGPGEEYDETGQSNVAGWSSHAETTKVNYEAEEPVLVLECDCECLLIGCGSLTRQTEGRGEEHPLSENRPKQHSRYCCSPLLGSFAAQYESGKLLVLLNLQRGLH